MIVSIVAVVAETKMLMSCSVVSLFWLLMRMMKKMKIVLSKRKIKIVLLKMMMF